MVSFGGRTIGDGNPCFITYEAGPTHNGVESAKRLSSLAAKAGADAIKFQILNPDRLVADRSIMFSYEVLLDRDTDARESVQEPLYDLLKRRSLSFDEWKEVKNHCDELGLAFFATVGFVDELEFLVDLQCDSIKIASGDVDHYPLIKEAAKTGLCLQLDTGNSTIGEIERAVDWIVAEGNENIIIHHCPSGYPARATGVNLNVIPTLKRMFPFPVAFSDHTAGYDMDIAAVALGANLLEKTITEDRTTRSVEHIMSLEPPEMGNFISVVRNTELAMGSSRRVMSPEERKKAVGVRRSIHLMRGVQQGDVLDWNDLDYRRPGTGISPAEAEKVVGRIAATDLLSSHQLSWADME